MNRVFLLRGMAGIAIVAGCISMSGLGVASGSASGQASSQPVIVEPLLPTNLITNAGTLSAVGGTFANTLSYTEPAAITATIDAPNALYKANMADSTCMTTDPCGWWSGDSAQSRANTATAYTPTSVKDSEGVTWTYRSTQCASYPTRATPVQTCSNVDTVTVTFSQPVQNAVIHINNLGGKSSQGAYDYTLFSQWTLTSGQTMKYLSGGDTTNIVLDGNTIRNKNTPQDLEAKVAAGSAPFADYANGTGSGSFQVLGTYSSLTFNIDLKWALVNDSGGGSPSNANVPEGVSMQISLYKSAPPTANPATASLAVGGKQTFDALSGLAAAALVNGSPLVPKSACLVNPVTKACGTTVTIAGEGTYTLNVDTGVVTYQSLSTASIGTKTPVTFRIYDQMGQSAEATLTPTVSAAPPTTLATPDGELIAETGSSHATALAVLGVCLIVVGFTVRRRVIG